MPPRAVLPFKQKYRARTHSECRAALCALCFTSSASLRQLTAGVVSQVQEFLHPSAAPRAFDKVVVACFGLELAPNYKEVIANFSLLYKKPELQKRGSMLQEHLSCFRNILALQIER